MDYILYEVTTATRKPFVGYMSSAQLTVALTNNQFAEGSQSYVAVAGSVIDTTKQIETIQLNNDGSLNAIHYDTFTANDLQKQALNLYYETIESGSAAWGISPDSSARRAFAPPRYLNWVYWVRCLYAVVEAVATTTDTRFNIEANRRRATEMFKILAPADRERQRFWYLNHNVDTWKAYRTVKGSGANQYFEVYANMPMTGDLPTFASDANSATLWDSTSGTLNIRMKYDTTPGATDFLTHI